METRAAKAKDFNAPAQLDMTNISVIVDDAFFTAYRDASDPKHDWAYRVYWEAVTHMLKHGEPGFSIDTGANVKENLRNAPVTGDTHVLTWEGYKPVSEIVDVPTQVWTGHRYADDVVFERTAIDAPIMSVKMTGGREIRCEPSHEFLVERWLGAGDRRHLDAIVRIPAEALQAGDCLHVSHTWGDVDQVSSGILDTEAYELGYIYGDGSFHKAGSVDLTLCSAASQELVGNFASYSSINEHDERGYTRMYFGVADRWEGRSKEQFPAEMYAEEPLKAISFVAGLFDADGNYEPSQGRIRLASKHRSFLVGVRRLLEQYGIYAGISKAGTSTYGRSQGWQLVVMADYHDEFAGMIPVKRLEIPTRGEGYRKSAIKVESVTSDGFEDVYCADVKASEHSFMAEGVIISNCTEITSEDDSDVCNLGSINLSRVASIEEFEEIVELSMLFLLAGTVYSDVPHAEVLDTRTKNRRLGLGLMGVHEWLIARGYGYEVTPELHSWLSVYATSTERAARWADQHHLSHPIKTRAIAPNGTIGIIGETTTSAEPVFCVAYKRRFIDNDRQWRYQYVIDPTAHRLAQRYGIDPDDIETAYSLAYNVEKRIKFQAELQAYVDHGISSTINLPYPITDPLEAYAFGETLIQYLHRLRGVTCYPDGARSGQPLTAVTYAEAHGQTGVTFEEDPNNACASGVCGV